MILTPAPLHKPASRIAILPAPRAAAPVLARSGAGLRPVLHTARVPQQLCLDLQPRPR